jgi:hypothetical protein
LRDASGNGLQELVDANWYVSQSRVRKSLSVMQMLYQNHDESTADLAGTFQRPFAKNIYIYER